MPHTPDPIQAQFIAARRNQILDAAAKVFAEKGFHSTTIKDIAAEAGIAYGSVYTYFESKPALLIGIFDRMKAVIMQENMPIALEITDLRSFIQILQLPLMGLKKDNFALFRIIVSEMMVNEELRMLYYQQIMGPTLALAETFFHEQYVKRGLNPAKVPLTMRIISGTILGLILEYTMDDPILATQWEELPELLAEFIVKGLGEA